MSGVGADGGKCLVVSGLGWLVGRSVGRSVRG